MKKIAVLLVFLCSSFIYSQDTYDVIAKETCECLHQKNLDNVSISSEVLQNNVGVCIIKSYTSHINDFKPEDKINFDDQEGMKKMGETVAIKMLTHCPDIILELGKSTDGDNKTSVDSTNAPVLFVEGEIVSLKVEQFVTILVKDKNGRDYSFLFLDYFDTASLYTENKIKPKDKIKVSYTEVELYDPKTKEFRYFKIISKLEKI